jgi:hypothetical protein
VLTGLFSRAVTHCWKTSIPEVFRGPYWVAKKDWPLPADLKFAAPGYLGLCCCTACKKAAWADPGSASAD